MYSQLLLVMLKRAADSAGGKHDGSRFERAKAAAFAIVGKRADDPVAVFEQSHDRALHVHVDALMDAVILQRSNHLQAGAVADVGQPRILVPAEVALKDASVGECDRRPLPTPRARGRGRALPWRAARPCASC